MTIHNDTQASHLNALLSLFKRACKSGYHVVPFLGVDPISTRAQRTRKGAVELDIYGDGSGLEAAFLGRVFMFGVEAR